MSEIPAGLMASPFLFRLARSAALLFAVAVLALLISCAHQAAQKPEATATEPPPNTPVATSGSPLEQTADWNYISSSKSGEFLKVPWKKTMKPVRHKKP